MRNPVEIEDGRLRVDSITGVPLELAIAGPGGRSFAFIIDFHIRVLGALAWFLGFSLILNGIAAGSGGPQTWLILVSGIPPLVIYFLYHPILEIAMAGRTPGKRMAGIRIVTLEGMVPGTGAIVVRNLFRFVDGLPVLYVVGLSCTIATRRHQRVGDFAAGTLPIYDDAGKSESLSSLPLAGATAGVSAIDAELIQDLIDRWPTLDPANRLELARRLLGRLDPASAKSQEAWLNDGNAFGELQNRLGALR